MRSRSAASFGWQAASGSNAWIAAGLKNSSRYATYEPVLAPMSITVRMLEVSRIQIQTSQAGIPAPRAVNGTSE